MRRSQLEPLSLMLHCLPQELLRPMLNNPVNQHVIFRALAYAITVIESLPPRHQEQSSLIDMHKLLSQLAGQARAELELENARNHIDPGKATAVEAAQLHKAQALATMLKRHNAKALSTPSAAKDILVERVEQKAK